MTKIQLGLISDADMYFLFGKGMRGRAFLKYKRYSQPNNKYLKFYDPKQELKHIIYGDENNIYGYVMSKFLSTSGFKSIDPIDLVPKNVYYKLILNILKNYVNYRMTIFWLQRKQEFKKKFCLNIN